MSSPQEKQQADRWRTLMELFDVAAELPPDERMAFLESTSCDSGMKLEVLELLQKLSPPADSRPLSRPEVPKRIGRYAVLESLGRGGMGEVFRAHDSELDRMVALKFLAAEPFGGRTGLEILAREASALSALNHPGIVTIHEVIQSGSVCAIVMELVEGRALRSMMGESLTPGQIAHIGRQIASALAAAHAEGIIHRDIKPENIFLRTDGYVKVLDFGLARRSNSESQNSTLGFAAGTVRYMSPEQTRGRTVTGATDVFSLGLVLYELATGQHPFSAPSLLETAHRIATQTPLRPSALNSAIPAALDDVILRMLEKHPDSRPSSRDSAILLEDARQTEKHGGRVPASILLSDSPKSEAETVSQRSAQSSRESHPPSRRWLLGSAATACLCATGVWWWRRGAGAGSPMRILLESGEVGEPAYSPDGSRIAFSWRPPGADRFQLAVIGSGGGAPRMLANGGMTSVGPAWSPDGKQICFVIQGFGENGLYMWALRDGTVRRLMTIPPGILEDRFDWIANSTSVVIADTGLGVPLVLTDLETGARRELPVERMCSDTSPKSSPDGKWIVFCRNFASSASDLFVIPTAGGTARRLTFDGAAKLDHRWTPDGRAILFRARLANHWGFWRVPAAGGEVREVRQVKAANGAFDVHAGRDGLLDLVSADQFEFVSICRMEIPADGQGPSRPVRMIASGQGVENLEANPAISPDGLRVAFVSLRSGSPEIWIADNAGAGARQITSFKGPEVTQPAWSPDGRYLLSARVTDTRRNLFQIDVASGGMRWLTSSGAEETEPQWSRDGRYITFASRRSGSQELWRMPAAGGASQRLTESGGAVHRESPDGRWLYFVHDERPGLWRIPWRGGKEELVLARVVGELYRAWAVGRRGVYYTLKDPAAAKWTVALYDPQSGTEQTLAVFDRPVPRWSGTLSVSPDERWMLLPIVEASVSRLVLFSGVKL